MANIDFNDLEPLEYSLTTQPSNDTCIGDLVGQLAYNLAILERALLKSIVPAGVVHFFMGGIEKRPRGFVIADGSWYNPTTYPVLFDTIKYRYGKREDGCFRVPDLRSSILLGMDLGKNKLTDISDYIGKNIEGNPVFGDNVGAEKEYCKVSTEGESCESNNIQTLAIPLISTGEICL